jgi:hypothetical protein
MSGILVPDEVATRNVCLSRKLKNAKAALITENTHEADSAG